MVFVRTDGNGDAQLFATSLQGNAWSAPKQITWHDRQPRHADLRGGATPEPDLSVAFEYANRAVPSGGAIDGTYQVDLGEALAAASPSPQLETVRHRRRPAAWPCAPTTRATSSGSPAPTASTRRS